jgi:hypothetical protein
MVPVILTAIVVIVPVSPVVAVAVFAVTAIAVGILWPPVVPGFVPAASDMAFLPAAVMTPVGAPWRHSSAIMAVVTMVDLTASLFDIARARRLAGICKPGTVFRPGSSRLGQHAGQQHGRGRTDGQFRSDSRGTFQHEFLRNGRPGGSMDRSIAQTH